MNTTPSSELLAPALVLVERFIRLTAGLSLPGTGGVSIAVVEARARRHRLPGGGPAPEPIESIIVGCELLTRAREATEKPPPKAAARKRAAPRRPAA